MTAPAAQERPLLHCDKAESVLRAIEASWAEYHAKRAGVAQGLYAALAQVLNEEGVAIDTVDGLDMLEHCRRRNLPIVDILYLIEDRVRRAGYGGDRLGLADFQAEGKLVYAFYDTARFESFVALKQKTQLRIATASP